MSFNTDEHYAAGTILEPRSPEPNAKCSSPSLEPTPLRTGMLDNWLLESPRVADSVSDPLEYIMMDTLSHLPAGSADRLLKSLQRSTQRAQRAERLVLKLKNHLNGQAEGFEKVNASRAATCMVSDQRTWRHTMPHFSGGLVILILAVMILLLVYGSTLVAKPQGACEPCASSSVHETSNKSDWPQNNAGSERIIVEELAMELKSLQTQQAECEANIQKLREKWRRAARQTPQVCSNEPPRAAAPVGSQRESESSRVSALAEIEEQQRRIKLLQAQVDSLQTDRSRCSKCLGTHGIMADCVEALREAAAPDSDSNR